MSTSPATAGIDLERAWRLHPQVSVRPEPFGALLYHFGIRKLSFLKDPRLLDVVQRLGEEPTALAACRESGVADAELPRFASALGTLVQSSMIVEGAP
ncbi:mycofactocin biosynthesis chaperone MftB [Sinomonas flava]|uniref:Mycofactocin biosynthesis chaperone MftB n=1 Tax=Sinomonas flava TaxID=496857 RepID=A0ABP5NJH5_9MICC